MEKNLWRPIKGYEGYYEVSNSGEIKSLERTIIVSGRSRKLKEKILKPKINNDGYVHIQFSRNGCYSTFTVHRLVAEAFLEIPDDKVFVNHINGNKLDNNVQNLEWVTRSENMQHAFKLGLCSKRNRRVRILDKCSGAKYNSMKEAATINGIKYHTLKKYLNGSRINKSCLEISE